MVQWSKALEEFLELGTEHHGSPLPRGFEPRHKAVFTLACTTLTTADSYWVLICPKLDNSRIYNIYTIYLHLNLIYPSLRNPSFHKTRAE